MTKRLYYTMLGTAVWDKAGRQYVLQSSSETERICRLVIGWDNHTPILSNKEKRIPRNRINWLG